jgi:hypothetical protein
LLVDPDRVLSCSVSLQGFKSIARQSCKIGKSEGRIEYFEPLPTLTFKSLERSYELASSEKLRAPVLEAQDHAE